MLDDTLEQQVQEVLNFLDLLLELVQGRDHLRALLREHKDALLTETTLLVLDALIDAEEDHSDPLLQCMISMRNFLEFASTNGLHQAWDEMGVVLYDALHTEQQFQRLLFRWLDLSNPREQRRFLEQHLELIQPHTLRRVQELIDVEAEDEKTVAILNHRRSIVYETLQRGKSVPSVRETYVNRVDGWSLDIPVWLEESEARITLLAEQPEARIALYRKAIPRARQDADVAPETLATLQHELAQTLRTTSSDYSSFNLEEAIALLLAAQQIFTVARYPLQHAQVHLRLGNCYLDRRERNRSETIEQALLSLEKALQLFNKFEFPLEWAEVQMALGQAYYERIVGEKSENLERALACQLAALEIYRRETTPIPWGEIQAYLGRTYQERIAGEKGGNLECAVACLSGALEVISPEMFPTEWAIIQTRLGQIYTERVVDDKRQNLSQAERQLQQTFQIYTRETFPIEWATTHLLLGAFYTDFGHVLNLQKDSCVLALQHFHEAEQVLTVETAPDLWAQLQEATIAVSLSKSDGVSRATFQQVIAQGKRALERLPRTTHPREWAGIHLKLAEALSLNAVYAERISDRADMMEQALEHDASALYVYTPAKAPEQWAKAQRIQAQIYLERRNEQQIENLARARHCCEQALQVLNPELSAYEWAEVQTVLGIVLLTDLDKQKGTIEQAIACFERSLERCDRITSFFSWARNHIELCRAYVERVEGDRQQNIETAIEHSKAVLQMCTEQNTSTVWAEAQFYLGIAYARRAAGERRVNMEQAIHCFAYAAEIFTEERAPLLSGAIEGNLGSIYYERAEGKVNESTTFAMQHIRRMQTLFPEESSRESALIQMRMAMLCQNQMQQPEDTYAAQTKSLYQKALDHYCNENDSYNAALICLLLGGYYQQLLSLKNIEAYRQQAYSYYSTALQTFTRERTPHHWALIQFGLGTLLGVIPQENPHHSQYQQEQAVGFLKQAMTILTPEVFPYDYRSILNIWQLIEWERGNWQEVVRLAQAIQKQEETLLRISTGTAGLDTVLAGAGHLSPLGRGAFAILLRHYQPRITPARDWSQMMTHLLTLPQPPAEDIEQATLLLESGRALTLARSLAGYLAAPERIQNAERRARYEEARKHMLLSRKEVDQLASLNNVKSSSLQERDTFLKRTAACESAQRAFEKIVTEIKQAQDPADFYTLSIDRTTLQQAARQGSPGHALVYLVALEKIGGFALAIQAPSEPEDPSLRFASCMLPGLTAELIQELVKDGAWQHLSSCQKTLAPVLFRPLLRWLQKDGKPSSLTLIPCGYLTGLPLTSLLMDGEETLGDCFPTSVAPSALSLLHTQSSDATREGIYTFGDPRSDLPFAEAEAHALRHIARQLGITSASKVQESVTFTVLSERLKQAQVIDVACHGHVNTDDYLQSYLLLDNKVTLGTILNWQRDMQGLRLLILAACEPATANLQGAVDEVRSIATAMLQAGACAVLAPLWAVDDRATFLLMTRFAAEWFPHMKADPPAAALARAQRWLRTVTNGELKHWEVQTLPGSTEEQHRSTTNNRMDQQQLRTGRQEAEDIIRRKARQDRSDLRPYADPIYWAGFQVVGW